MATIQSSLQLYDGMTGPLRAISNAMNITISTFESMQTASEHALDVAALQSAREELAKANVSVDQMERSIQMAGQSQDKFNRKIQDGQGIAAKIVRVIDRPDSRRVLAITGSGQPVEFDTAPEFPHRKGEAGFLQIRRPRVYAAA